MERKIGEIFEYNGEWYQCVEDISYNGCDNCHVNEGMCDYNVTGYCHSLFRNDCISVCFKKLKKVGRPYNKLGIVVQKYKVDIPIEMTDKPNMYFRLIDNTVEIEIKQN